MDPGGGPVRGRGARIGPVIAEVQLRDRAGMDGRLRISLVRTDRGTTIGDLESSGALRIVRPFPLEGGRILLQILTVGPGLLAGDRYRVEIHVGKGARAVVLHQSAGKVHRMAPGRKASQHVRILVEEDGRAGVLPGPGDPVSRRGDPPAHRSAPFPWLPLWLVRDLDHGPNGARGAPGLPRPSDGDRHLRGRRSGLPGCAGPGSRTGPTGGRGPAGRGAVRGERVLAMGGCGVGAGCNLTQ